MWTARRDGKTLASGYHLDAAPGHARSAAREAAIRRPPPPQERGRGDILLLSAQLRVQHTTADSSDHTS